MGSFPGQGLYVIAAWVGIGYQHATAFRSL